MKARKLVLGFDADDTLWHNETIFRLTQARFRALMADLAAPEALDARLAEVERRNLALYGYGVKGFTLSLIETAMELTAATILIAFAGVFLICFMKGAFGGGFSFSLASFVAPISRSWTTGVTMPLRNMNSCVPIRIAEDTTM